MGDDSKAIPLIDPKEHEKLKAQLAQEQKAYKALLERESLAADHNTKLATELSAAREVIGFYADANNNWGRPTGMSTFCAIVTSDITMKGDGVYCGGKRAREFMKQFEGKV